MLLLHNKDQQQNNSRTFRSRFSQPAPAGKGADMMNCKLTTAWHENIEPVALVQSVISAKKLPLQEINQLIGIEMLTSSFLEYFDS